MRTVLGLVDEIVARLPGSGSLIRNRSLLLTDGRRTGFDPSNQNPGVIHLVRDKR